MKLKSDIQTWGEWLHMRWCNLKFFIYKMFHRISRFQNWEIDGTVKIKAKKKGMLIAGNTILEGGHLILKR